MKYVECVPNFSEGRDKAKIDAIVNAARMVSGVYILDVESDVDHNRTVLTFIAPVDRAVDACFEVAKKCVELIDLNKHTGQHPRMGALDVAPFVPIMDTTIDECIELARQLGKRIGEELNVPVYLYDQAAQREDRRDLAKVRKGQFEGLREEIGKNPDRVPDFGPNKIHPTAGAVAVGARYQIVNFNVNLKTVDMEFAKDLAKKIRTSGGGLPALRAKEIFLESKNQVQISTVLTNYNITSIKMVIDEIKKQTEPRGIDITDTELIGLTATKPLVDYAISELKVSNFSFENQILENRMMKFLTDWRFAVSAVIEALSNTQPTPGGGAAAAMCGAMGVALIEMAFGITIKSKKTSELHKKLLSEKMSYLKEMRKKIESKITEDCMSFDEVMKALKTPKDDPSRQMMLQQALVYACQVPLSTAMLCSEVIESIKDLKDAVKQDVISDYKSGVYILSAAIKSAVENVYINAKSIEDKHTSKRLLADAERCKKVSDDISFLTS